MKQILIFIFLINVQTIDAALLAPNLSSPSDNNNMKTFQVSLSVKSYSGATDFQFQIDTINSMNSGARKSLMAKNALYTLADSLRKNKSYYWRARAVNGSDTSPWSSVFKFNVLGTMNIMSPANLSSGGIKYFQVSHWGSGSNIKYLFEMDTVATLNSSNYALRVLNTSSLLDSQYFKFGRKIYWRATAVNFFNDTLIWTSVYSYTISNIPGVIAKANLQEPYTFLGWPSSEKSETEIQLDTSINFNSPNLYTKILRVGIIADTVSNLFFGKTYYYRIRAKFMNQNSNWSTLQIFTIKSNLISLQPSNNLTMNSLLASFGWAALNKTKTQIQVFTNSGYTQVLFDSIFPISNFVSNGYYWKDTLTINTTYFWRIRALHQLDTTKWQNMTFKTFDGKVTLTEPANNAVQQNVNVNFKFEKIQGAVTYLIEIDTGKIFPVVPSSYVVKSSTFFNDNQGRLVFNVPLRYATNYVWRVLIISKGDTSTGYNVRTFKTIDKPKLDYPFNTMIGVGTTLDGVMFYQTGGDYVLWELDTISSFNSPALVQTKDTNVEDNFSKGKVMLSSIKDLLFETKYYWRARMLNAADTSDWSFTFNFVTTQQPWITYPATNSTNIGLDTVIKWNVQGSVNEQIYQYQFSKDSTFTGVPIQSIPIGNSAEKRVTCDYSTKYFWRARAFHNKDTSSWTITANFTTKEFPLKNKIVLQSPANLTKNITSSTITLTWQADANAASYDIQIASDTNFLNIVSSGNTSARTINFTGAPKGATFYWRVRARLNTTLVGPWSDAWRFSTVPNTSIDYHLTDECMVYPNPTDKLIHIQLTDDATLVLINSIGQVFMSQISEKGEIIIDSSIYPSGVYTLRIIRAGEELSQQLIIQH